MDRFSGYEYLQMDVAANNPFGGDKFCFQDRIKWTETENSSLELIANSRTWKEKPLYLKAVMALRKAQAGQPTGHMVGFDAVCSGMQLMSVMTGCESGARATGLIDPDRRPDAYTDVTAEMTRLLGFQIDHARSKVKTASMTALYASRAEPKAIFGEDTPELEKFYKALWNVAPGACKLLQSLLNSWQDWKLTQEWTMPDGGRVRCRVMQDVEKRIEVNELNHHTFTYRYQENEGEERGLKNVANVIHSVDAWVLRSVVRRCSYDLERTQEIQACIIEELMLRELRDLPDYDPEAITEDIEGYMSHYQRSGLVDIVILPYLYDSAIRCLSTEYLRKLNQVITGILEHPPFPIITVHDEYKCHPNHMNQLRRHYRDVLAELADANLMQDILSQIHGKKGTFDKLSDGLGDQIRKSNYALC